MVDLTGELEMVLVRRRHQPPVGHERSRIRDRGVERMAARRRSRGGVTSQKIGARSRHPRGYLGKPAELTGRFGEGEDGPRNAPLGSVPIAEVGRSDHSGHRPRSPSTRSSSEGMIWANPKGALVMQGERSNRTSRARRARSRSGTSAGRCVLESSGSSVSPSMVTFSRTMWGLGVRRYRGIPP